MKLIILVLIAFPIGLSLPVRAQENFGSSQQVQKGRDASMKQEFLSAALAGELTRVKELLQLNPMLAKTTDDKGLSVILKSTYHGKTEIVAALLATPVELDVFEASATGQTEQVLRLAKQTASLVNSHSVDGFTPLGLAAFFGHEATVRALLDAGALVNEPSNEKMRVTPLASATAARQLEIARLLISRGANVNAKAENNLTPLHEAAASGQLELAEILLNNGANVSARTLDSKTPLIFATARKQTEMIKLLERHGAKER